MRVLNVKLPRRLRTGKKAWILEILPEKHKTFGYSVCPYILFTNIHDDTGAIKVAIAPVRVVCQNTLNLVLHDTKKIWTTNYRYFNSDQANDFIEFFNLYNVL